MSKPRREYLRAKLAPTPEQEVALDRTLRICQDEYARAAKERQDAWAKEGRGVTYNEQSKALTVRKRGWKNPLQSVYNSVLRDVLWQVQLAFVTKNRVAKFVAPTSFRYLGIAGHELRAGGLWLSKIGEIPFAGLPPDSYTRNRGIKIEKAVERQRSPLLGFGLNVE